MPNSSRRGGSQLPLIVQGKVSLVALVLGFMRGSARPTHHSIYYSPKQRQSGSHPNGNQ